jgi:AmmeMemoRadiSam system protein B
MVASARAAFMSEVGERVSPKTIVLLSPDHFNTSQKALTASTQIWETSLGDLVPDLVLIDALQLPKDKARFTTEHGITTVLRDIKKNFPDSLLVPVIVSNKITLDETVTFTQQLYEQCPDCLLIASVDFSHSVEREVARLHDTLTLRELSQGDIFGLYEDAEVDSPASLAALAHWARLHQAKHFSLFAHTNSGDITGVRVGEMTTHIMGSYAKGEAVAKYDDSVTMMFGGNVTFSREGEGQHKADPSTVLTFGLGERFFAGVDIALINLAEDFNTAVIPALTSAGITAMSANDSKTGDMYVQEFVIPDTVSPEKKRGAEPDVLLHKEGETNVAIITVNLDKEITHVIKKVTEYSERGHFVIVYTQIDGEETPIHTSRVERFIDAGASLIVGSHTQGTSAVSLYNGVPIVTSLRSLVTEQKQSASPCGVVLGAKVDTEAVELFLVPIITTVLPVVASTECQVSSLEWKDYESTTFPGWYIFPRR